MNLNDVWDKELYDYLNAAERHYAAMGTYMTAHHMGESELLKQALPKALETIIEIRRSADLTPKKATRAKKPYKIGELVKEIAPYLKVEELGYMQKAKDQAETYEEIDDMHGVSSSYKDYEVLVRMCLPQLYETIASLRKAAVD